MRGRRPSRPERSEAERNHLIQQYLPLVRHVLGRLAVSLPRTLDREDLVSAGVFGLMHAAASYDPARGASFKTYAFTAIRGAILDELRRHDPVPRSRRDRLRSMEQAAARLASALGREPTPEELARELGITLEALDADLLALKTATVLSLDEPAQEGEDGTAAVQVVATTMDPMEEAAAQELQEILAECLAELPETERRVVVLYYHEGMLLKEIGRVLGVTESRVSQILTRAIVRLRQKMGARGAVAREGDGRP